jgi:hypothetical protein
MAAGMEARANNMRYHAPQLHNSPSASRISAVKISIWFPSSICTPYAHVFEKDASHELLFQRLPYQNSRRRDLISEIRMLVSHPSNFRQNACPVALPRKFELNRPTKILPPSSRPIGPCILRFNFTFFGCAPRRALSARLD